MGQTRCQHDANVYQSISSVTLTSFKTWECLTCPLPDPLLSSSYSDHLLSPYQNLSFFLVHPFSPSPETIMIPNWRPWLQYLYFVYSTFSLFLLQCGTSISLKMFALRPPHGASANLSFRFPWINASSGNLSSCIVIRRTSVGTKEAREGRLEEACRTSYVEFDRQTAASIQDQWLWPVFANFSLVVYTWNVCSTLVLCRIEIRLQHY